MKTFLYTLLLVLIVATISVLLFFWNLWIGLVYVGAWCLMGISTYRAPHYKNTLSSQA